jgi:hypothetical protein
MSMPDFTELEYALKIVNEIEKFALANYSMRHYRLFNDHTGLLNPEITINVIHPFLSHNLRGKDGIIAIYSLILTYMHKSY